VLLGSHVDEFIIMKSHNPSILQPVMNNAADIIPGVGMTLKGYAVWLSIKMYTFALIHLNVSGLIWEFMLINI